VVGEEGVEEVDFTAFEEVLSPGNELQTSYLKNEALELEKGLWFGMAREEKSHNKFRKRNSHY